MAFSQDKVKWFLCSCCKDAVQNLLNFPIDLQQKRNHWGLSKILSIENHVEYLPNLCHLCNNQVPTVLYCSPMYGTLFFQKFGWYVSQECFKQNMNPMERKEDFFSRYLEIENDIRRRVGYPLRGEKYQGETNLYYSIKRLLPEEITITRHYRPKWLQGLEIDIYIEDLKIGFEYQGQQHYNEVKHWGGKKKLIEQQEHDKRKKEICQKMGIKLYEIRYDEQYDDEMLLKLLKK